MSLSKPVSNNECGDFTLVLNTADNLSNAKPAVQQRHPGDLFPVSQRGSAKVNKQRVLAFESR